MATLSQLLELSELDLTLVQSGAGDPTLTWASTTELLDLGRYLEGGEVVLTTGLALGAEDPRWRDFVAALSRARVAAIGFGVGVTHDRIPRPLVAAASTYRVALFEVPPPVPFIAVSKAVAGLLHADDLRVAQSALQVQQRLLDRRSGGRGAADVLSSVSQAIGRQLAVVDAHDEVIASTAAFDRDSSESAEIAIDKELGTRLLIAGGSALSVEARAVVAAGAMVLGLELRGMRVDDDRERLRWSRLVDGMLNDALPPAALDILDHEVRLPERIRAIAVLGPAEAVANWCRRPRIGLDRLVSLGRAVDQHPRYGSRRAPGTSIAWQLCPDTESSLEHALDLARQHGLDAIIGRSAPPAAAGRSFRSAAARVSALSSVDQLYAEPRVPTALWIDRETPILDALILETGLSGGGSALSSTILGPLSLDPPSDAPALEPGEAERLRTTLECVLARNGQRGPTSVDLGIHRNTLRDRLARIEAVLGRRIDDPDDRAELWLAIRLENVG